jgi:serine/threonine-protein kinase HipA
MRIARVYRNHKLAGKLTEANGEYIFRYDDAYFTDSAKKPISLTLPKTQQEYRSKIFFPFFFNILAEGDNKRLQCRQLQIDENDYFSLLTRTAGEDTIGCITVNAEAP